MKHISEFLKCPHCDQPLNPASLMGKLSASRRDTSSERMRKVVQARWNKKKSD